MPSYNRPGNWNPYQYPQPTAYQAPYQSAQRQPVEGLIRVTGYEGAKAYDLPPNSNMPLFDGNEDVFYVKTTDGAGFATIRAFKFEEIAPEVIDVKPGYVTKEELNTMANNLADILVEIKEELKDVKQPVPTATAADAAAPRPAATAGRHIQQDQQHSYLA